MDGRTYERGLAVHSRCILTFDLNGRYSRFETLVGFDEARGHWGASIAASSPTARSSMPIATCGPTVPR